MDIHDLDRVLLIGAGVLLVAILAVRASVGVGLPSLLFYLGLGVLLGDSILGVPFDDAALAQALGFGALVLILAEGGLTTSWVKVRDSVGIGLLLATVGSAVSVVVVAVAGHVLFGLDWQLAVLLAAVTAPTDAAAVFSVLRRVPLRPRVIGTLEAESGLNDAPIVLLVVAVSAGTWSDHHPVVLGLVMVAELVGGGVLGFVIGRAAAWALRRVALGSSGLYPLAVLATIVFAYGATTFVHGSGFAAVYVCALVLGNAELPHRAASRSFAEGIGWLAQIGLFVMLGLLVTPATITWWQVEVGIVIGAVLTFVARPLSVLVCTAFSSMTWREQAFLSWAGLRGAVPIVLAAIPLAYDVESAASMFNIVFVFVVVYTVLQAPTLPWAARRLGVTVDQPTELDLEAAPLERMQADLLQVHVSRGSRLAGVEVGELRLPPGVQVALLVRAGESFVPHRTTRLKRADDLLVVAPREKRAEAEERLRQVSRSGRLAGWYE
ncbi:UNVERIFIED_CONTAM: potassium transporter [Mumia flava]|uniref:potassium/proton antiporter n=1 Tax=Mumia flava TaxID=1348852 RepID=UPI0005731E04|nr:potassium/proton antiporter [Mumia flava]